MRALFRFACVLLLAAVLCAAPGPAAAQDGDPRPPDLPGMDPQMPAAPNVGRAGGNLSSATAAFTGEISYNYAGTSVAGVGDVNGDGYADLLVGASGYGSARGAAYLFLGGPAGWNLDISVLEASAIYTGEPGNSQAGLTVAGAGDVNGDGYADMLIGAYHYNTDTGKVYLVLGGPNPASMTLPGTSIVFTGEATNTSTSIGLAGAGDVNGDGYADFLIGAYTFNFNLGRVYLVLGSDAPAGMTLPGTSIVYTGEGGYAGYSLAGAGDVNGDGYDDVLIGAAGFGTNYQGKVYLVLGSSAPAGMTLPGTSIAYNGPLDGDNAGESVAGAGDVNGDGYADLLIGASGYNSHQGRAFLVLGSGSPASIGLDSASAIYTGEAGAGYAGWSAAGAGDVNGDGYADMLIGAPYNNGNQGRAYLVLGSAKPASLADLGTGANAVYTGEGGPNRVGWSMSGAGDVNGDGYSDLLIGAPLYNSSQGRTYLVLSDYGYGWREPAVYRQVRGAGDQADTPIGASGVSASFYGGRRGAIQVVRYTQNSCNHTYATRGLLWRVDSYRGSNAVTYLTFAYNPSQFPSGMNENSLKLWRRTFTCQAWTEDTGAFLDTAHNQILATLAYDPHFEYAISVSQPSPSGLEVVDFSVGLQQESPWLVAGLAVLLIVSGWMVKRSRRV